MAVPKRKLSKSRSRKRYAHYMTATPGIGECSHCHELKANHTVCPKCGYYNGIKKIELKTAKSK